MDEMSRTQAEAFSQMMTTVRAVVRDESPVNPNNVIVRIYRRCLDRLKKDHPGLFADGADMQVAVHRLETMTLARWMREYCPPPEQPAFVAFCETKGYDLLSELSGRVAGSDADGLPPLG